MGTLTFVLGPTHYCATLYIRDRVRKGDEANRFRNITNPNSLRGLRATENTKIELVLMVGWWRAPKADEFAIQMDGLRARNSGVEIIQL